MKRFLDFIYKQPLIWFSLIILAKLLFAKTIIFDKFTLDKASVLELTLIVMLGFVVEFFFGKGKIAAYLFLNFLLSVLIFSMVLYKDYYGSVLTINSIMQISQAAEVKDSIFSLFKPVYLLFFFDVIIWIAISIYVKSKGFIVNKYPKRNTLVLFSLVAVANYLLIATTDYEEIINETKKAEAVGLLNYQMVSSVDANASELEVDSITPDAIRKIKNIEKIENPNYEGIAKNKNIVVVQLEAFQNFVINEKIDGQEITPSLNELIKNSLYFPNFYQQIGKGNTSDAEFMINTSIYPVGDFAMSQKYADRDIPSLPKVLKGEGYESLTFHTNDKTFWNREEMYKSLGFNRVYDKKFYGIEDTISFGSSDEILYSKSLPILKELRNNGKNFYVNYIAMSSHHPFEIPSNKKGIELPSKFNETIVGDYIQATNYADKALGSFINDLKANGMWEDTLFVVYGDHMGLSLNSLNERDAELISELTGKEYDLLEMMNIPLIISIPNQDGDVIKNVGGQIDLMPTISNLIGLSLEDKIYFGQDILNQPENLLGERFYAPTGTFINENMMLIPGKSYNDGTIIKIKNEQEKQENPKNDFERVIQLLNMSDTYVDKLPKR